MRRTLALVILLLTATSAFPDQVDDYVNFTMRQLHIPGLALAILKNGEPIKIGAYGFASLELKTPVTEDTIFEIGSVTKQFTGAAILILVKEGKIGLDDPIDQYFQGVPVAWKQVTIRHLLTHSSGIPNYLGMPGFPDIHRDGLSHDEITKLFFERLQLEFQPGETWSYSNSGYLLLGNLIEKVSGKNYWDFLNERIFKPAGMNATRNSDPQAVIPFRAAGYEWRNDHFENRPALAENAYSAGSIVSNIVDMAHWDRALRSEKILDNKMLEIASTRNPISGGNLAPFNYGFGWFIDTYHGRRVIAHSGGTPGFSSVFYRFVDEGLTVILLTNHSDRVIDPMAIEIAGFYVPVLARPKTPAPDPDSAFSRNLQNALTELIAGKVEPDRYTKPMQLFLTTVTGKEVWPWVGADGPIQSFVFSEKECAAETCTLRYMATLGSATRWFSFTVTADGKIAQINWW